MEWVTGPNSNEVDIGTVIHMYWITSHKGTLTPPPHKHTHLHTFTFLTGFMPLMRIYAIAPSSLVNSTEDLTYVIPSDPPEFNFSHFKWNREIPLKEAISKLEKTMYPFKEVCNTAGNICFFMQPISVCLLPSLPDPLPGFP